MAQHISDKQILDFEATWEHRYFRPIPLQNKGSLF